jgi:hypothetical protein
MLLELIALSTISCYSDNFSILFTLLLAAMSYSSWLPFGQVLGLSRQCFRSEYVRICLNGFRSYLQYYTAVMYVPVRYNWVFELLTVGSGSRKASQWKFGRGSESKWSGSTTLLRGLLLAVMSEMSWAQIFAFRQFFSQPCSSSQVLVDLLTWVATFTT